MALSELRIYTGKLLYTLTNRTSKDIGETVENLAASNLGLELLPFPRLERLELWQSGKPPDATTTYGSERGLCVCLVDLGSLDALTSGGSVGEQLDLTPSMITEGYLRIIEEYRSRRTIFPER
jgi:hypothetical protein